jgi:WD40 repeat protein
MPCALPPLHLHRSGVVLRVIFHPKQLLVISGGDDATVRVWDLVTRACVAALKGHVSAVTSLTLSVRGDGGAALVVCLVLLGVWVGREAAA